MILIVTNKQDTHADEVIRALGRRNVGVFRINTEDFHEFYSVSLRLHQTDRWDGEVRNNSGRSVRLSELRAGWIRRPDFDAMSSISDVEQFIRLETRAFFDTLYSLPGITWVNDPFRAARAKVKFSQLILAQQLGAAVPSTIITNDAPNARSFVTGCGCPVITKPIYTGNFTVSGRNQGIPTRRLTLDEFDAHAQGVGVVPTKFQPYIEKDFEVRVSIFGDKVYAVKIDSQLNEDTEVDWRVETAKNPHSVLGLPDAVSSFCVNFLRAQGLLYGAMDFIVTPGGEYVFLENNPFGQYLWLEFETGLPLTEAMCDLLVSSMEQ